MSRIKNARFMRAVETDGKTVAEVEFSLELSDVQAIDNQEASNEQKYVAVLENDGGPSYNLRKVFKNDSDLSLDWYDNSEHEAYTDVTSSMFGNSLLSEDRESFVKDVLDYQGVRKDMESGLS